MRHEPTTEEFEAAMKAYWTDILERYAMREEAAAGRLLLPAWMRGGLLALMKESQGPAGARTLLMSAVVIGVIAERHGWDTEPRLQEGEKL